MKIAKLFLALFLSITANQGSAQYCTENTRFTNTPFFSNQEIQILSDVSYADAVNFKGDSETLKMDFYFPDPTIDPLTSRPFILLIFPGGFDSGNKNYMAYECREFAKRGFVAATINYRVGFDKSIPGDLVKAVYRAQQDANAALRYVVENADNLKIDTSWIFIGGSSAGAVTSLYTAYANQQEWNRTFSFLEPMLGSLNTSGNTLSHFYTIKGIYNNQGTVSPIALSPETLIPMISFHGELDKVVPMDVNPETGEFGSRALHNLLNEHQVCNDFTIDPDGGHGIYQTKEGFQFRVERAACFFKSLFCNSCTNNFSTEDIPANCSN